MSYLSCVRFNVKPGRREDFLRAFESSGMLSRPRAIPGFKWGKLNEAPFKNGKTDETGTLDESGGSDLSSQFSPQFSSQFMVIAEWETEADYATWQAMAIRALDRTASQLFLDTLIDASPGVLFKTVLASEA